MYSERATFSIASWLFVRFLGLSYFFAFSSFWYQFPGLIGPEGILPVSEYLAAAEAQFGWWERIWLLPTLCWISDSELSLHLQFALGAIASLLLLLGIGERLNSLLLWLLWLSLSIAGQTFLGFQWDALLLEAGFLALWITPCTVERSSHTTQVCGLFLYRWLLFRLMFASGMVKLLSGDPTWRSLSALQYHYFSQPLPSYLAYYAHRAPELVQTISCFLTLLIELIVPFLLFGPRVARHFAAFALLLLQILIATTGNYAYFNLLTAALCLLAVDDRALTKLFPNRLRTGHLPPPTTQQVSFFRAAVTQPLTILILFLSCSQLLSQLVGGKMMPSAIETVVGWAEPFRSVNRYGLFAVMTTERPEIILEGSEDGKEWLPYRLKWKPHRLAQAPTQVAPHQPRLDWQMWFAALSEYRRNPWFLSLVRRLLENSPVVLDLFEENPFPQQAPKYIRALVYKYEFTTLHEKATQGTWWKRELAGYYLPAVSLENFTRSQ